MPLRRRLASGRLRVIGLKKCLVHETVTVNVPGPDRASRWEQDQSEWQIEWQTVLAGACLGLADARLCSRSA
jgi:hypothetical protein